MEARGARQFVPDLLPAFGGRCRRHSFAAFLVALGLGGNGPRGRDSSRRGQFRFCSGSNISVMNETLRPDGAAGATPCKPQS